MISDNLKKLRKRRRLVSKQVAKEIGINCNYLSQIENGKSEPSGQLTQKLISYYKTKPAPQNTVPTLGDIEIELNLNGNLLSQLFGVNRVTYYKFKKKEFQELPEYIQEGIILLVSDNDNLPDYIINYFSLNQGENLPLNSKLPSNHKSIEDIFEDNENFESIKNLIGNRNMDILESRYEGLSFAQIAKKYNLSRQDIHYLYRRSLKMIYGKKSDLIPFFNIDCNSL
ncbi:MAG: helix-turn-helix domain-containing protein [Nanoarchaeota archaeon]|nr:helix-turn-helix domain-containing protein [Nanoarchaeota archaeon]MBU0963122.1 helix-turn-helix domain-containing protein [Nanoarchaeota archaeon]